MTSLERQSDELWTNYLARRMGAEGIKLCEPSIEGTLGKTVSILTAVGRDLGDICLMRKLVVVGDLFTHYGNAAEISDEIVTISPKDIKNSIEFHFDKKGKVQTRWVWDDEPKISKQLPEKLQKYGSEGVYSSQTVIEDIVEYAKSLPAKSSSADAPRQEGLAEKRGNGRIPAERREDERRNDGTLQEILSTVKDIQRLAREHPVVLKRDDVYLRELYTAKIGKDLEGNYRQFEHDGHKVPYVLVHSTEIDGKTGRQSNNLFFVARDKAPEDWQEKIVAWHEYWESEIGHDKAIKKERELAKALGKEKDYTVWANRIREVPEDEYCRWLKYIGVPVVSEKRTKRLRRKKKK